MIYILLASCLVVLCTILAFMFFGKPIKIEIRKISMTEIHESQRMQFSQELQEQLKRTQQTLNDKAASIEQHLVEFNNTWIGGDLDNGESK